MCHEKPAECRQAMIESCERIITNLAMHLGRSMHHGSCQRGHRDLRHVSLGFRDLVPMIALGETDLGEMPKNKMKICNQQVQVDDVLQPKMPEGGLAIPRCRGLAPMQQR